MILHEEEVGFLSQAVGPIKIGLRWPDGRPVAREDRPSAWFKAIGDVWATDLKRTPSKTDAKGNIDLYLDPEQLKHLPPGGMVRIQPPFMRYGGWNPSTAEINPRRLPLERLIFTRAPLTRSFINLLVTDQETGAPVPGTIVDITYHRGPSKVLKTDEEGKAQAELSVSPDTPVDIIVAKKGYPATSKRKVGTLSLKDREEVMVISMSKTPGEPVKLFPFTPEDKTLTYVLIGGGVLVLGVVLYLVLRK